MVVVFKNSVYLCTINDGFIRRYMCFNFLYYNILHGISKRDRNVNKSRII